MKSHSSFTKISIAVSLLNRAETVTLGPAPKTGPGPNLASTDGSPLLGTVQARAGASNTQRVPYEGVSSSVSTSPAKVAAGRR